MCGNSQPAYRHDFTGPSFATEARAGAQEQPSLTTDRSSRLL